MNMVLSMMVEDVMDLSKRDKAVEDKLRGQSIFMQLDREATGALSFDALMALDISSLPEEMQRCLTWGSVAELLTARAWCQKKNFLRAS